MVVAERPPRSSVAESADGSAIRPRRSKPITWWALLGAAAVAMQAYVMGSWILTDAAPVPTGPTPQTKWDEVWGYIWQIGGLIALAGFVYGFVIRPSCSVAPFRWTGCWCCASASSSGRTRGATVKPWGTYNTYLVQWGSWVEHLPGWMSPRGNQFAEPLLVMVPVYVWGVFGFTIIGCKVMRAAKRRWPAMGTAGMIAICYVFFMIVDLVLEGLWMRTGIRAYPGGGPLSLFEGSRYQFPIKEMFLWGGTWAAFTCLRYFRNNKGETFAERGAGQLKNGPKRKLALQFLALYGAINFLYFFAYNLPINIVNMHDSTWSKGVQEVTYMNDNLCGPGTGYACPTKDTPIPWNGSAHATSEGTLAPAR